MELDYMNIELEGNVKKAYEARMKIVKEWSIEIKEKKFQLIKAIFIEKGFGKYVIDSDMRQFLRHRFINLWDSFYVIDHLQRTIFITAIKVVYNSDIELTNLTFHFETTDQEPVEINFSDE